MTVTARSALGWGISRYPYQAYIFSVILRSSVFIHFSVSRIKNKVEEVSTSVEVLPVVGFGKAALLLISIWGCGVLTVGGAPHPVMRHSNGHLPQAYQTPITTLQVPLSLMWLEILSKHFYSQLAVSIGHYETRRDCANLFYTKTCSITDLKWLGIIFKKYYNNYYLNSRDLLL